MPGAPTGRVARAFFGKCAFGAGGVRLHSRSRLPVLSISSGLVVEVPVVTLGEKPVVAFGVVIMFGEPTSIVAAAVAEYVTASTGAQWIAKLSERLAVL